MGFGRVGVVLPKSTMMRVRSGGAENNEHDASPELSMISGLDVSAESQSTLSAGVTTLRASLMLGTNSRSHDHPADHGTGTPQLKMPQSVLARIDSESRHELAIVGDVRFDGAQGECAGANSRSSGASSARARTTFTWCMEFAGANAFSWFKEFAGANSVYLARSAFHWSSRAGIPRLPSWNYTPPFVSSQPDSLATSPFFDMFVDDWSWGTIHIKSISKGATAFIWFKEFAGANSVHLVQAVRTRELISLS
ncbi:hypothetical protein DFH27DRAFT_624143 [Peziza echinospora]|nr:hypothetical protein DFH27DRAFT_624143 [Peziza echinospora]